MSDPGLERIDSVSLSDIGRVRQANEDSFGEFRNAAGARLFIVADGMGGHRGGATASRTAVEIIGREFEDQSFTTPESLAEAIRIANRCVHERALENPELRGMGTTAVCLLLTSHREGCVAHVGDSRVYRFRDRNLELLTEDHSVVATLVRQGLISAEEADTHPRRNEILRSIGVEPEVEVEIQRIEIDPGDRFLLCSDGLTGLVPDAEIAILMEKDTLESATRSLVDAANECGGNDNITVQIAAIPQGDTAPSVGAMTAARFDPSGLPHWALVGGVVVGGLGLWWWLG